MLSTREYLNLLILIAVAGFCLALLTEREGASRRINGPVLFLPSSLEAR